MIRYNVNYVCVPSLCEQRNGSSSTVKCAHCTGTHCLIESSGLFLPISACQRCVVVNGGIVQQQIDMIYFCGKVAEDCFNRLLIADVTSIREANTSCRFDGEVGFLVFRLINIEGNNRSTLRRKGLADATTYANRTARYSYNHLAHVCFLLIAHALVRLIRLFNRSPC